MIGPSLDVAKGPNWKTILIAIFFNLIMNEIKF